MAFGKHTLTDLQAMQAAPLSVKIRMTQQRIREWVNEFGEDGVYISFSGGKDSTALLHLVREIYPNIPAVFCDTGLEFPEIRNFVKTFENVEWIKPKMTFRQVIEEYGYPFISKEVSQNVWEVTHYGKDHAKAKYQRFLPDSDYNKRYKNHYTCAKYAFLLQEDAPRISHKCCKIMKKDPSREYEKRTGRKPILGMLASESKIRTTRWLKTGCNAFDAKLQTSNPMSFWTTQDVLLYIKRYGIKICEIYGNVVNDMNGGGIDLIEGQMNIYDLDPAEYGLFDLENPPLKTTGYDRTGCMFCGYGCHLDKPGTGKFELMRITHPKLYDYIMRPWESEEEVMDPKTMKHTKVKKYGLNFKYVIDWINEHGNMNIQY